MKHTILFKMLFATIIVAATITGADAQGIIRTIAGTGTAGLSGDGGSALSATLSDPEGVAVDAAGNVYIADKMNARIRMVSEAGNISTIAGTTLTYAMGGMGGLAIDAHLIYPNAMFLDAAGNYYASDWFADAAYEGSTSTGHIANICGHDSQGCTGDGGLAPAATMAIPGGIWVDNMNNVYIVDYGNNRIRKVDGTTHIVTTFINGYTSGFEQVNGVCADDAGNVYISDQSGNQVKNVDASGTITVVAGTGTEGFSGDGGSALSATFRYPGGLFINSAGDLFICDVSNSRIRVVNTTTGIINTVAGNGDFGYAGDGVLAIHASLNGPTGVWQDATGNIYIADAGNNVIRKVTGATAYYRANGTTALTSNDVTFFPNPSTGTFTIQTSFVPDNCTAEVYNIIGEKVFSTSVSQQQTIVNLNQPAGVYSIKLRSKEGVITEKVTIE